MTHAYILDRGDVFKGALLGGVVFAADIALKLLARVGGCEGDAIIDEALVSQVWSAPATCAGTDMAGPSIRLLAHVREGLMFGLGPEMTGFNGQLYALALLLVATVLTIVIARWRWSANGDPRALALVWAGGLVLGLPRLMGDGSGLAELQLSGLSAGIGDLALCLGLVWLGLRFLGEFRA